MPCASNGNIQPVRAQRRVFMVTCQRQLLLQCMHNLDIPLGSLVQTQ